MTNRFRWVVGAALVAGLSLAAGAAQADGGGGNPFGRGSTSTVVTLQSDGSYLVRASQSQELVRAYAGGFGGWVHDGFRLPDDGSVIPPYLRATYVMGSVTLDGQPVDLPFSVDRHRVEAKITRDLAAGLHTAELDYTVRGATRPVPGGYTVHVYTLARKGQDTATIDAGTIPGQVTGVSCVTYAPESEPCGTRTGDQWTVNLTEHGDHEVPNELVISVRGSSAALSPPVLDHE